MKVSREGIVLIKSFEGFRPRAIRREDGGWIIGYGHTLSAREGASVSEADAELLLRYDLLSVEKAVNAAGSAGLNQHQFDALTSFAFSVGVERFRASDVMAHLTNGAPHQAADALMGWPEPALPQVALRRRVAERALFITDPDRTVAVSDLLVTPVEPAGHDRQDPAFDTSPTPSVVEAGSLGDTVLPNSVPDHDRQDPLDQRAAAVSVLLGETQMPTAAPMEPGHPGPVTAEAVTPFYGSAPPAANDREADPPAGLSEAAPLGIEPALAPASSRADAPANPDKSPTSGVDAATLAAQRFAPYSAPMVGPLPFLQPARDRTAEPDAPPTLPTTAEVAEPAIGTPNVALDPAAETPVIQPFATAVEPLVLSTSDEASDPALSRTPWTTEDRGGPTEYAEGGLFGEDLSLTHGGVPILRHGETEMTAPAAFDWSETGAFIIMGAVGLTAFGAAMAAFRLASEQTGGNETTIIAWVLAVIGAGCVGVSSFNLYRRWGLPGGDN